ncbi:ras-related protein Rab-44 isoform X4 [Lathamus discolor]|uniref:ras-related protein Rab-44 isoform X4 n=1 Tax=Lathamus discolor TaxID=678569 RepID=UPI0032B7898F
MWDGRWQEEVLTQWVLGSQPLLALVEAPSVLRCSSYCQTQGPFTAKCISSSIPRHHLLPRSPASRSWPRIKNHQCPLDRTELGPMAERRAGTKSRRLGSSRRKGFGEAPAAAPSPSKEPPWAAEIVQRVQELLKEQDKDQAGFVSRSDIQELQEEDLPCSTEELELVFDGLDAAGTGRLRTEDFTFGLWQFLSSQKAARDHRRRKTASRRVRLVLPSPALEEVDSEERRQFSAFMNQLGTDSISEGQEIWELWRKLRQDEPQLLDNQEDFVAKMRHHIQEVRSKKEALEETLNKRVAEHGKEVQRLCGALEQRIQREQQRLEQESMAPSPQRAAELQRMLDASEKEVQRLVTEQLELETRCHSLRSTQEAASTENWQLEESKRVLEQHLQHLHQQLRQTHGRLRAARAAVAWEHVEEPGDRAVAELPSETPTSPQMSPEQSKKYHSEMQTREGSQSSEPKAKSIHQVVWEMLPAEISLLGAPQGASSVEEGPFPESLKEEHFSEQSSLLREMDDATAALSNQLKPQAPGAPPAPAKAAHHPQDDAEPQVGLEEARAHGTTPRVQQETLSGHVGHGVFEGDMEEGPGTAPDVPQAGASTGAGHHRAQEPEQGEEEQRMLFPQGKGGGVKEVMLKVAEHLQGALGENTEAGEQVLREVEGAGWMQERTSWEKAQLLGKAEEASLSQGENLEAGLGSPGAGEAGLVVQQCLGMEELHSAAAQPRGTGLGEEAQPPLGLSKELELKPGELLEPEPPPQGEARIGAAQGHSVLPDVTVAPGPGMLEEDPVSAEAKLQGETLGAEVLPAQAQRGAGAGEREVHVAQDVRLLGASGQAAQSELQEQVSAQAEKPPHTMETEKAAAGPAELPKQELAPASPLHTRVLQEEDAGNDQLGTVFGGSSLWDAASMQPQRQSLGEQSKDLDVDQWKKQEAGNKMSQEGEPSPGEPGNVAADGARIAPRGSPKAPLDPDHLYNVLFVGDSHVGKTSFLYRLHADTFNPHLTATVGLDYQVKSFVVDNKCFALRLWDSAGQERYHSITKQFFRKADGVVLMYDITSEYSFLDVQYWLSCIQEGAEDGVAILLLGNKTDCAAERQVPMEQGERLAKEHQLMFYECSAASGHNISESMVSLIRLLKVNEDKLKNKAEEVPKLPQKKKSCCW